MLVDSSSTVSPVRDADGAVVGLASISRDVSQSKRAQRELACGRERLEQAELTARMGSWDWDLVTGQVSCSAGLHRLFGLPPEIDGDAARGAFDECVHADDRASVRAALGRATTALTQTELAFRAVGEDGRVRFFDGRVEPVADETTGEPVRLIGVVYDVTEARRAQEALNAASSGLVQCAQELQRLAAEQALSGEARASVALTTRQLEIMQLVARGLTNAEIAERIVVSEGTVKWHIKQILHKTGAANRTEAVARVLGAETARQRAVSAG